MRIRRPIPPMRRPLMARTESAMRRLQAVRELVDKYLVFGEDTYKAHLDVRTTLGKVLGDIHQLYLRGETERWRTAIDEWAILMKRYWTIAPEYALTYGAIKTMEQAY